jgi:hypothetical protein
MFLMKAFVLAEKVPIYGMTYIPEVQPKKVPQIVVG